MQVYVKTHLHLHPYSYFLQIAIFRSCSASRNFLYIRPINHYFHIISIVINLTDLVVAFLFIVRLNPADPAMRAIPLQGLE